MELIIPLNLIGIPWQPRGRTEEGCDCWGLVRLAYSQLLGIPLPAHDFDPHTVDPYIVARERAEWEEIARGRERPGDVLLFELEDWPAHVGIVVSRGRMLHSLERSTSCIQHYNRDPWSRRFVGAYRRSHEHHSG